MVGKGFDRDRLGGVTLCGDSFRWEGVKRSAHVAIVGAHRDGRGCSWGAGELHFV